MVWGTNMALQLYRHKNSCRRSCILCEVRQCHSWCSWCVWVMVFNKSTEQWELESSWRLKAFLIHSNTNFYWKVYFGCLHVTFTAELEHLWGLLFFWIGLLQKDAGSELRLLKAVSSLFEISSLSWYAKSHSLIFQCQKSWSHVSHWQTAPFIYMQCFSLTGVSKESHLKRILIQEKRWTLSPWLFPPADVPAKLCNSYDKPRSAFFRSALKDLPINSDTREVLQYFISGQQKGFLPVDGSVSVVTRLRGPSFFPTQWLIMADEFRDLITNYSEQGSVLYTVPCTEFRLNFSCLTGNLAS